MSLWSLLRLVSQRSLRSCRLELDDRPIQRAALFPLFDDRGQTRMVMITAEESGRIMLADWAPGVFVRDWRWRNRLRLRSTDLSDASIWDDEHFDELWHFDPWWVLGEERYQGHAAVPCEAPISPATIRQRPTSCSIRAWDARRTWRECLPSP